VTSSRPSEVHTPVTIVVPCFNEETGLVHLHRNLSAARSFLGQKYRLHFILVDDGSTDNTWKFIGELFGNDRDVTVLRHAANRGIGAAILTGIREARTEIVCSIDSDCSYDPRELAKMIPLLIPGIDLVTASPYHPQGQVLNVSVWRLFLSKTASRLYRLVLKQKLYTYTSCFRVYRRCAILKLDMKRERFLAVAELIAKLDLHGSVVIECPSRLSSRVYGASKMKVVRSVFGHLQLLCELAIHGTWQAVRLRRTRLDSTTVVGLEG